MSKPAADAKPGAPRKGAFEALRLGRLNRHDEAIALVDELAARHPGLAILLQLAGKLHLETFRRTAAADRSEETEGHAVSARGYLSETKRLVTDCLLTSVLLAEALHESSMYDEADDEITRGLAIESPVDPVKTNIAYSAPGYPDSNRFERMEETRCLARNFYKKFRDSVVSYHVPRVVREALELETDEHQWVVKTLKVATNLAKRYHYSPLALCFRGYMRLKFARCLDADIDRRPFLQGILVEMNGAVAAFDSSLVLGLFRAKLCFVLGACEIAETQCRTSLLLEKPADPNLEDVPPGSVNGEEYADRVCSIHSELGRLMVSILNVARSYWYSMTSEKQDCFLSVRLVDLHQYYDDTHESDHWAARTITEALSFVKKSSSWRFWICPYCPGRKLPHTDALLLHFWNRHPADQVLSKLQLYVPKQSGDTSGDDYMMDDISVCPDLEENYVFHFKNKDSIFEHLFPSPCMEIEGKSFAEIRDEKCEKMKQKLTAFPADKLSAGSAIPEIEDLWYDFLEISPLDYRIVMSPLVKSFIWSTLIQCMWEDSSSSKKITNADIDNIFPSVVLSTGPKNDVHVEDGKSGAMVNEKSSDEDGNKLGTLENVGTDLKCDRSAGISLPNSKDQSYIMENTGSQLLGTSDQPDEETPNISRYKRCIDVLKQYNAEDLFFLNVIVQSLWNLKCFRREILRRPPACFYLIHEGPCLTGKLYEIFSLEKNEHFRIASLLTDLKTTLCEIVHDSVMFHKVGRNFASEIVAMIIEGLHKSDTFFHFCYNVKSKRVEIDTFSCTNFICRAHELFGIKLKQLMSCSCGEWFSEEYTSIFHGLDASSLYATKTNSLAKIPVLMDQRLNCENKCNKCSGSVKHIDSFLSHGRHFFTIVLKNLKTGEISKATMSEAFFGIESPFDITLLYGGVTLNCEGVRPSTKYNLLLAVCHFDQRYVCLVRDHDKWHIYDTDTVKVVDSWEELLEHYGETSLQPEILFLEVIK